MHVESGVTPLCATENGDSLDVMRSLVSFQVTLEKSEDMSDMLLKLVN